MSTPRLAAVLGPTNTGKTHYAVERMMGHVSGMMGFPLRLLAREIYDRVVGIKGRSRVALITGEEKILPDNPAYFICTVESMPLDRPVAFLAVDEIQMCADPQRGHVFTDRLFRARGSQETLLLGAETVAPLIRKLVPEAEITSRQRFSKLGYAAPKKLSRLPRRSAVVAFSADDVYANAELIRRQRGGAAIVMGALSPRTRNAQVALYQSGDVDYIVATDAIGMGLNMDIDHVAFAGLSKFDGRRRRALTAAEIAQIAGRAGRHMNDGTFSTIAGETGAEMAPEIIAQVEEHRFPALRALSWRSSALDFASPKSLIRSLEELPQGKLLRPVQGAVDLAILKAHAANSEIAAAATTPEAVRRLWDVAQIPDFRKISLDDHVGLTGRIYRHLTGEAGVLPHAWMAENVTRLERVDGDIDTLAARIAAIRIWTYVSHRKDWLDDAAHWSGVTRAIEDKLSDALHDRLTQRFVDRRTSVLMRQLKQRDELVVAIGTGDEIEVEGHFIGRLKGFSFLPDRAAAGQEYRTLEAAAERTLHRQIKRRVKELAAAPDDDFALVCEAGVLRPRLSWRGAPVLRLRAGAAPLKPRLEPVRGSLLSGPAVERVIACGQVWLAAHMRAELGRLVALAAELEGEPPPGDAPPLAGLARGVAFRLVEHFGILPRATVDADLKTVDAAARKALHRHGVRIGAGCVYQPALLKPAPTRLRLLLWALAEGRDSLPDLPSPGMVWAEVVRGADHRFYEVAGFRVCGNKAIRVDMLERLADAVRPLGQDSKSFEATPEIMGLVGLSGEDFAKAMAAVGYRYRKTNTAATEPDVAPRHVFTWKGRRRAKGESGKAGPARRQRRSKRERSTADPDSPFAALAALRKAPAPDSSP